MENKKSTPDKSLNRYIFWRRYRWLIGLIAFGLIILGRDCLRESRSKARMKVYKEEQGSRLNELLKTPTKDFYVILENKNQHINLRPKKWTKDSITFEVCGSIEDSRKISSNYLDYYHACSNKIMELTFSKEAVLGIKCQPEYTKEKRKNFCKIIPELSEQNPFRISKIIKFNGVEMEIRMGWDKNEVKQKTISIQNKGLPLVLKEIRSSVGEEIKLIGSNLPLNLSTNARFKIRGPIEKKLFPNSYNNQYKPYNFKLLIETKENGEEIYEVNFKNNNTEINADNLEANWD